MEAARALRPPPPTSLPATPGRSALAAGGVYGGEPRGPALRRPAGAAFAPRARGDIIVIDPAAASRRRRAPGCSKYKKSI